MTNLMPATSGLVSGEIRRRSREFSSSETAVISWVQALIQAWGFWMAVLSLSSLLSSRYKQ